MQAPYSAFEHQIELQQDVPLPQGYWKPMQLRHLPKTFQMALRTSSLLADFFWAWLFPLRVLAVEQGPLELQATNPHLQKASFASLGRPSEHCCQRVLFAIVSQSSQIFAPFCSCFRLCLQHLVGPPQELQRRLVSLQQARSSSHSFIFLSSLFAASDYFAGAGPRRMAFLTVGLHLKHYQLLRLPMLMQPLPLFSSAFSYHSLSNAWPSLPHAWLLQQLVLIDSSHLQPVVFSHHVIFILLSMPQHVAPFLSRYVAAHALGWPFGRAL